MNWRKAEEMAQWAVHMLCMQVCRFNLGPHVGPTTHQRRTSITECGPNTHKKMNWRDGLELKEV